MADNDTRARDLAAFANAGGQSQQPMPGGHSLVRPTSGLAERVIGAQPVAVYRDEAKILQKFSALAAAAGQDWFYRFPVKRSGGGQDYIEGPSIKLANDIARIYGNNSVEVREVDVGDAWVFYARFSDIETGFSMERAYRQRKGQSSMKMRDSERALDIAYQIGQSKAIRNVICNALQTYADYAFEQARGSLIEKIGSDLPAWRDRTLQGLAKMPVDVTRVERVVGRAAKDWLAPQIAQVVAMMRSVADGMATVDETFPPIEAPQGPTADNPAPRQSAVLGEGGGAQGGVPAAETMSVAQGAPPAATDPLTIAYHRGREAKSAGQARKALPPEYRQPGRIHECDSWLAGWDGKAL